MADEAARTPTLILNEIMIKLGSIDGISTGDAFALGMLVFEYGDAITSSRIVGLVQDLRKKIMEENR